MRQQARNYNWGVDIKIVSAESKGNDYEEKLTRNNNSNRRDDFQADVISISD